MGSKELAVGAVRFVGGPSDGHVASFPGEPPESIAYDAADGTLVKYVFNPQTREMKLWTPS